MQANKVLFALVCVIFAGMLTEGMAKAGSLKGKPNPINPNFTYVEANKVNTAALNIPYPGEFYTGYITVNQTSGSKIFYQLYSAGGNKKATTVNASAPLIMQLAGGPGVPGGGSFYEHGPFRVTLNAKGEFQPVLNDVTWNDDYHLLYLDNPVGVGYAVQNDDIPKFATDNGVYLLNFLIRFFEIFPNLKNQPFYGVGESYGGHFVLGLAHHIINNPQHGIKLTGIGMQSGWYDPYWQISTWGSGLYAVGLIDFKVRGQIEDYVSQFQKAVKAGDYETAYKFVDLVEGCVPKGVDTQDYRNSTEWDQATAYWLNMPAVKKALGADPNAVWESKGLRPWFALDFVQSYAGNITHMLNTYDISFLIYQGQNDFKVPAAGTENSIVNLGWIELPLFVASKNNVWRDTDGNVIGQYKHYKKLTYAMVNKASHNGAHDQPWSVKDLIQRWVNNKW